VVIAQAGTAELPQAVSTLLVGGLDAVVADEQHYPMSLSGSSEKSLGDPVSGGDGVDGGSLSPRMIMARASRASDRHRHLPLH
jgi:hypothetical protein